MNPKRRWIGIALRLGGLALLPWWEGCRPPSSPGEPSAAPPPSKVQAAPSALSPAAPRLPRPAPVAGQTVVVEEGAVSLCLPEGWKRVAAAPPLLLKFEPQEPTPGFTPTLFLISTQVPGLGEDPPLDEIEAALVAALPEQSGQQKLQIVSTGRLLLGNRPAITVAATLTLAGTPVKQKQYFLYVGDRQYILTGLAPVDRYPKLEPLFDGVAASLKVR